MFCLSQSLPLCPDSFISAALSYKQKSAESHHSLGYNEQANMINIKEVPSIISSENLLLNQPEPNIKKSSLNIIKYKCIEQHKTILVTNLLAFRTQFQHHLKYVNLHPWVWTNLHIIITLVICIIAKYIITNYKYIVTNTLSPRDHHRTTDLLKKKLFFTSKF